MWINILILVATVWMTWFWVTCALLFEDTNIAQEFVNRMNYWIGPQVPVVGMTFYILTCFWEWWMYLFIDNVQWVYNKFVRNSFVVGPCFLLLLICAVFSIFFSLANMDGLSSLLTQNTNKPAWASCIGGVSIFVVLHFILYRLSLITKIKWLTTPVTSGICFLLLTILLSSLWVPFAVITIVVSILIITFLLPWIQNKDNSPWERNLHFISRIVQDSEMRCEAHKHQSIFQAVDQRATFLVTHVFDIILFVSLFTLWQQELQLETQPEQMVPEMCLTALVVIGRLWMLMIGRKSPEEIGEKTETDAAATGIDSLLLVHCE